MAKCRHTSTEGKWISAAHIAGCLGVPRAQLVQELYDGKVRFRIVGRGRKRCIQVWTPEASARWPQQFDALDTETRAGEDLVGV